MTAAVSAARFDIESRELFAATVYFGRSRF
jgi:hypothetical protein